MKRVCRNCKWFYANDSMNDGLYLCVNGNSEMLGNFVGYCSEDKCEDFESVYDFDDEDDDEEEED